MDFRLPAHLEVSALLRQVQTAGGFGAVLHKGEREAGTILLICAEKGANRRIFERMPSIDGPRVWCLSLTEHLDNSDEFDRYLDKRMNQDCDLWIVELDIVNAERFIGLTPM